MGAEKTWSQPKVDMVTHSVRQSLRNRDLYDTSGTSLKIEVSRARVRCIRESEEKERYEVI